MNNVILIGRLTSDPNVTYKDDIAIARFTLAVDRMKKGEADFIRCVAFGKNGEFYEKFGKKGFKVAIAGHILTGSYKDKEGKTVYTTDVVVDRSEFCESKSNNQDSVNDGFVSIGMDIDEEELPFN